MTKKKKINIVYSTNPNFNFEYNENHEIDTIENDKQKIKIYTDKKQRKGKTVTIVNGFVGNLEDLKNLAKELKNSCGVGGTVKSDEILIQGDFKEKIYQILLNKGFKQTKKIGG